MATKKTTSVKQGKKMTLAWVKGTTTRSTRSNLASYNGKTRRFTLPLDVAEKSKRWEVYGSTGADTLMVKPVEGEKEGRACHPAQHFVTVPASLAGDLKSKHYAYAFDEEQGGFIFTPEA